MPQTILYFFPQENFISYNLKNDLIKYSISILIVCQVNKVVDPITCSPASAIPNPILKEFNFGITSMDQCRFTENSRFMY